MDTPAKTSNFEAVIKGICDMHICYVMFTLPRWLTVAKMWVARNKLLGIAVPDYGEIRTIEKALTERDSNEGVQYMREATIERSTRTG